MITDIKNKTAIDPLYKRGRKGVCWNPCFDESFEPYLIFPLGRERLIINLVAAFFILT